MTTESTAQDQISNITPQNDEERTLIGLIMEFDGSVQQWFNNELDELHEEADEDKEDLRDLLGDFIQMAKREGLKMTLIRIDQLMSI